MRNVRGSGGSYWHFAGKSILMARLPHKSREARLKRAQKILENTGYIPRAAKYLAEVMVVLSESSPGHRVEVLARFSTIANDKMTWTIAGKRL